jgi:hypothetical protein
VKRRHQLVEDKMEEQKKILVMKLEEVVYIVVISISVSLLSLLIFVIRRGALFNYKKIRRPPLNLIVQTSSAASTAKLGLFGPLQLQLSNQTVLSPERWRI